VSTPVFGSDDEVPAWEDAADVEPPDVEPADVEPPDVEPDWRAPPVWNRTEPHTMKPPKGIASRSGPYRFADLPICPALPAD
jgi:hypothetical protein